MQCHRGIALSLHSVFNDLLLRDTALFWKLAWSGSKLLIDCAFLATNEPFLAAYITSIHLFSGLVSNNCYYYLEVCIASIDVTVPIDVDVVCCFWVMTFCDIYAERGRTGIR